MPRIKTRLEKLREAVDDLHAATCSYQLDQKSHGPNVSKNSTTSDNYARLIACTRMIVELLPEVREEVVPNPTSRDVRRLEACEREFQKLIAPYDSSGFLRRAITTTH